MLSRTTDADESQIQFLNKLRSSVSDSKEFRALAARLYGGVRDALRKDDLPSFGTLTRHEQEVLVNRVRTQMINEEIYKKCRDATWRALDAALDEEAEVLLQHKASGVGGRRGPGPTWPAPQGDDDSSDEDESARHKKEPTGKVGAILELASEGASLLLDKWPAAQDELLWLLNTELPTALRKAVWSLKLRAPAARVEYEKKRSESVFATLSLRDGAVHQGCQATLQSIAPTQLKQTPFLKTCLSYADSLRPLPPPPSGWPSAMFEEASSKAAAASSADAGDAAGASTAASPAKPAAKPAAGGGGGGGGGAGGIHVSPLESFWGVPLLRVFVPATGKSPSSAAQAELEAQLIEHFLALLAMPKPLLGLTAAVKGEKGRAVLQSPLAEQLLGEMDEELSNKLTGVLGVTGIDAMLLPYAQRLAVGFFSAEVTLLVWDLCLLAGWQQLQPALCAALICMRDSLLAAADANAIKAYLAQAAPHLTLDQMQRELNLHFMPAIREAVGAPEPKQAFELTPGGYF
jgi:hypothetical protein